jgi:aspartate/methionine/tyrosine aminotransferase
MKKINFFENRFLMFVIDNMAYELEKKGHEIIRMTLGKSELPIHKDIVKILKDSIEDFNKYSLVFPSGLPELKSKLSKIYNKKHNINSAPNNIIISTGTSSIFRNLYQILLNDGDEVLIPRPYYSLYKFCGAILNAKIKYYNINYEDMSLDIESFKNNFNSNTKIVVINSPGNPLGNILKKEDFLQIDEIVNGKAYVISDEIYMNMSFDGEEISALDIFGWGDNSRAKSKFIITNSLSKGYRMYSKRVGWCLAPEELVTPLTVMQHHTLLTADPVVQFAAVEALNHSEDLDYLRKKYKERRDYVISSLKDNTNVKVFPAKGSFYITLDCSLCIKKRKLADEFELAKEIINSIGVAVVPGSDFGAPGTIRLSYTCEKFKEGIDRLNDFFKK